MHDSSTQTTRRQLLSQLAATGIGSLVFQRALAAQAADAARVTPEMIERSEWLAGITLQPDQREVIASTMARTVGGFDAMRAVPLPNDVSPAIQFRTAAHDGPATPPVRLVDVPPLPETKRPAADDDLAFASIAQLAHWVRTKQVSSLELTRLALTRLKKHDPTLVCVATLTEDLALRQAEQADREIAAGQYRGPLHGIPWGAKDLIAVPNYPTAWGAPQFREQKFPQPATVVRRLEEAGAVLTSKLSVGALAWGDDWYGGVTKNPWHPREGSSGSSAGSSAATAAGLVPFALGSETLGSIVSPCTRCGVTGLRPTYGRVSRHGCMSLAWSMDKIGPIARNVADCALAFSAIHGTDGLDTSAVDRPFVWPWNGELKSLRVGFVGDAAAKADRPDLAVLRDLGVQLVPIELPVAKYPIGALSVILDVEAATVFDELTRSGNTDGLNRWPAVFRKAEFVPAVEYLRANRIRTLVAREMERLFQTVDLYVGGNDLLVTNLTGHPTVVLPNGFEKRDGAEVPTSITFTGRLFGEAELLAVADAYQRATGHHLRRPPLGP